MKKSLLAVALLALAACSTSSESGKKDTYQMQKGGMSSQTHQMPASTKSDEQDANKKKDGYRMEKGPMGSVGHEMK